MRRKGEVDAKLMGTSAWALREVDAEHRRRFIAEGWWGDQSIGQRMFDGLAAHRGPAVCDSFADAALAWHVR